MQRLIITKTTKQTQKLQDKAFKSISADKKMELVGQFFEMGKKLQALNDRKIDGNHKPAYKHS